MTITVDISRTWGAYLNAYTPSTVWIRYGAALPGFDTQADAYLSGIGIDPVSPDPENEIFATIEDAFDHYDSIQPPNVITNLNDGFGVDYYVLGDILPLRYEPWALRPDTLQPLDATLTALSGLTTTPYGRGLLSKTGASQMRSAIGVQTLDDLDEGTTNKAFTDTDKTKLDGIADDATKVQVYSGFTLKSTPTLYTASATVSSGVAVFYLTYDGTSSGTALFPNGPITSSLNTFVNDETASYQTSCSWSNSNKTLTITLNKLTTSNITTGVIGQAAANSAVVSVQVWGN